MFSVMVSSVLVFVRVRVRALVFGKHAHGKHTHCLKTNLCSTWEKGARHMYYVLPEHMLLRSRL